MYIWRSLTDEQRAEVMAHRISLRRPWHGPPLLFNEGQFHLSAACYEHQPYVGRELKRLEEFSQRLLETLAENNAPIFAWCVLPNHYHLLVATANLAQLKLEIGKLHGRTSYDWNLEENAVGRKTWHRCADRKIRSEAHYWATINYIHNNPVHHGYVSNWSDWPFSSAAEYLAQIGREKAIAIWREYPVLDYGKGWDDADI